MRSPLQILHLEDDPHDAEFVKSALVNSGIDCDMVQVETETDFVTALKKGGFELILADYSLPQFDGLSALSIAQEKCPDVPFILVSGAIGEELAIEILKKGATDYVHKDKLSRLIPAINRALREAKERAEHKQAREALRDSEKKYRELVDNALIEIYKTNLKGDILYVNEALWRMLEFESSEEMMAESVLKRYKNLKDREVLIEKLRENNKVGDYEVELLTKTGKIKNVLLSAVLDGDNISGMMMDITERRQAEDKLIRTEEEYRTVVEDMPALICRFLHDGTLTFVNEAYCKYFKKSREELVGNSFFQFIPEEEKKKVKEHYAFLTQDNPVITYEHKVEVSDRTIYWQRWTDRAIFDKGGRLKEYQSIGEDITERKRMEEELKKRFKELEDFYNMAVGRELRMIELKKEIAELKEELEKYKKG